MRIFWIILKAEGAAWRLESDFWLIWIFYVPDIAALRSDTVILRIEKFILGYFSEKSKIRIKRLDNLSPNEVFR